MGDILSSFEYGIPAAIIVALYLVINKIIDKKSEKKTVKLSSSLIDSFNKLNTLLDYFTKDIIDKEQDKCQFAIKTSFNAFCNALVNFSINTIINNNVDNNKQTIIENVQQLVSTEYWNVYSCLLLFKAGNNRVSEFLDDTWKDELIKDMTGIIFDKKKTKDQRLYNINNKIRIDINSYCVHVVNRYATSNN